MVSAKSLGLVPFLLKKKESLMRLPMAIGIDPAPRYVKAHRNVGFFYGVPNLHPKPPPEGDMHSA